MDRRILIIKHVEQEGAGLIGTFFGNDGWDLEIVELGSGGRLPESIDSFAAVIVLGGPMNVYQIAGYPFLEEEEHLIRRTLIDELPMLGICLGAQLLAKTCGAKVVKAARREVGFYPVHVTDEGAKDPLFKDFSRQFTVFEWHEDTFGIPEGGLLLARGKTCRNQAFRMGRSAYGLQFHPEVTHLMIEEWMKAERGKVDTEKIICDSAALKERFEDQTGRFLINFRTFIESSMHFRRLMNLFMEDGRGKEKKSMARRNPKEPARGPAKGS